MLGFCFHDVMVIVLYSSAVSFQLYSVNILSYFRISFILIFFIFIFILICVSRV